MVLNYIWVTFFVIAFIVALVRLIFMGDTEIFTELVNSTFDSSKNAFQISLGLTGILALWLGLMKIGENSGMINALSRWLSPVFCRLFPEIPKGHPAMGSIFMNLSANMLGLDNAATPLGLKAMKELQELTRRRIPPLPNDYVPGNQYFRIDIDTCQHYDVSCPAGSHATHGYLHSYTAHYFHIHARGNYRCQYFATYQSDM